jgi:prepilin-type N-terminal cleavage/methylation domain-containing protein
MRPASIRDLTREHTGFTLIELIVAMAVFAILGSILVSIFVSAVSYFSSEKSQLFNQSSISEISAAFEADTRKASGASISSNCLILTIASGNKTYCLNTTTQIYTRNNVQVGDHIATVSYDIVLNKLTLTVTTTNDRRGINNTIKLTYYLREGNY